MKKTLIINIGNSIIHLEEDAYEVLTNYLLGIKAHFSGSIDNFEIVTDIENRIAELLLEKLKIQQKQVVNLSDVEEVTGIMGNVNDFSEEESEIDENTIHSVRRQLYRDMDQKIFAGVCSGMAQYLNLSVSWVRVFFLLFILFWGFGILFYLILWIIVPPAKRRLDKMAMRGEAPDLHGFKRSFEEELVANSNFQKSFPAQLGQVIGDIFQGIGKVFNFTAQFVFKAIAFFIIIMGVGFLLTLIVGVAGILGFMDDNIFQYFPFSIVNPDYQDGLLLATFITFFIPILALVLLSIRYVFNKQVINRTLSFALLIIWIGGVCFTTFYAAKISSEFKESAEITQKNALPIAKEYVLTLDNSMLFNQADSLQYGLTYNRVSGGVIVDDLNDHPFKWPRNVRIDFESSTKGDAYLVKNYHSQGYNFKNALDNARNIDYKYSINKDTLSFSPRLLLTKNTNWRNQEVKLILGLPVGSRLKIERNLIDYLGFGYWECTSDYSAFSDWIITENGIQCLNNNNEHEHN